MGGDGGHVHQGHAGVRGVGVALGQTVTNEGANKQVFKLKHSLQLKLGRLSTKDFIGGMILLTKDALVPRNFGYTAYYYELYSHIIDAEDALRSSVRPQHHSQAARVLI